MEDPFEMWIDELFQQKISHPLPPHVQLHYLSQFFDAPRNQLERFGSDAFAEGLWMIVGETCDVSRSFIDPGLPFEERRECLLKIPALFENVFARECSSTALVHQSQSTRDPLSLICYMWWDIFPTWGDPTNPVQRESDILLLDVMGSILSIDHSHCIESALHGLGHWHASYPDQVTRIVDEFLAGRGAMISPDLKSYAQSARSGLVA